MKKFLPALFLAATISAPVHAASKVDWKRLFAYDNKCFIATNCPKNSIDTMGYTDASTVTEDAVSYSRTVLKLYTDAYQDNNAALGKQDPKVGSLLDLCDSRVNDAFGEELLTEDPATKDRAELHLEFWKTYGCGSLVVGLSRRVRDQEELDSVTYYLENFKDVASAEAPMDRQHKNLDLFVSAAATMEEEIENMFGCLHRFEGETKKQVNEVCRGDARMKIKIDAAGKI